MNQRPKQPSISDHVSSEEESLEEPISSDDIDDQPLQSDDATDSNKIAGKTSNFKSIKTIQGQGLISNNDEAESRSVFKQKTLTNTNRSIASSSDMSEHILNSQINRNH